MKTDVNNVVKTCFHCDEAIVFGSTTLCISGEIQYFHHDIHKDCSKKYLRSIQNLAEFESIVFPDDGL